MQKSNVYNEERLFTFLPEPITNGLKRLKINLEQVRRGNLADDPFVKPLEQALETLQQVLWESIVIRQEHYFDNRLTNINSIEEGVQFISNSLSNRIHSTKYLFEESALFSMHIDSFSNLLLFAETLVKLFERIINSSRKDKLIQSNGTTTFLVDISPQVSLSSRHFVPQVKKTASNHKFIGITISENIFFHIHKLICLLLHEIGHHFEAIHVPSRNFVAYSVLSNHIVQQMENNLLDFIQNQVFPKEKSIYENPVYHHINSKILPLIHEIIDNSLKKHLLIHLQEKGIEKAFLSYSLRECKKFFDEWLSCITNEILVGKEIKESNIVNIFFDELSEYYKYETEEGFVIKTSYEFLYEKASAFLINDTFDSLGDHAYIMEAVDSLLLFGLNEPTPSNKEVLLKVFLNSMERAIKKIQKEEFLNWIITLFDEVQADMFMIKVLQLNDRRYYQNILDSISFHMAYSKYIISNRFGIRSAIVDEYFHNSNKNKAPAKYSIKLNSEFDNEQRISDYWATTILPITKYFKELHLDFSQFEISEEDLEKITDIRAVFSNYISSTDSDYRMNMEVNLLSTVNSYLNGESNGI